MKIGDLVQVKLPFQKGRGILVERIEFFLPNSEMKKYEIANDYRWTVLYEGRMSEFHQHNIEVISGT